MTTQTNLANSLRQMLAILEQERQALAALDIDALTLAGQGKSTLCERLDGIGPDAIDAECRGLLEAAKQANEVNRRVRNLVAANVAARLDALGGTGGIYRSPNAGARYSYATS